MSEMLCSSPFSTVDHKFGELEWRWVVEIVGGVVSDSSREEEDLLEFATELRCVCVILFGREEFLFQ